LVGELTDQVVQLVGCSDDVVFLFVEVADELVELLDQASVVVFLAGERGAKRPGDVLGLAQPAALSSIEATAKVCSVVG